MAALSNIILIHTPPVWSMFICIEATPNAYHQINESTPHFLFIQTRRPTEPNGKISETMKKLVALLVTCLWFSGVTAQVSNKIAVLNFKANVGIMQSDVDGISSIFTTYFSPQGWILVERAQIDKAIKEQGFQKSTMTQEQMVRIGEILNVQKIVIGDVNIIPGGGGYNVDIRIVDVATGDIPAKDGAEWNAGTSYRSLMESLAKRLSSRISTTPEPAKVTAPTSTATQVITLYGYLIIHPRNLGVFTSEPTTIIAALNKNGECDYDSWRLPTQEELELMLSNVSLIPGMSADQPYMTDLNKSDGEKRVVRLVTTNVKTISERVSEQQKAEQLKQQELAMQEAERKRIEQEKLLAHEAEIKKFEALRTMLKMQQDTTSFVEEIAGINMKMIYVEGGEFLMGATSEQGTEGQQDEQIVRRIRLNSFYIGECEVTQDQWRKIMGRSITQQASMAGTSSLHGTGADYPMYYITWEEAQAFCQELKRLTGRNYCLPTEAQWEYAARCGQYNEGTKYCGSNIVDAAAWYDDNSESKTHPVKSKSPNSLGLYDMSGNVWEWCSDWYGSSYNVNDTNNPTGPSSGMYRVLRGGSWISPANHCRISKREHNSSKYHNSSYGFRVAMIP